MQPTIEQINAAYSRAKSGNSELRLTEWVRGQEEREALATVAALNLDASALDQDVQEWIEVKKQHLEAIVMVVDSESAARLTCFGGDALFLYRLFRHQLFFSSREVPSESDPKLLEIKIRKGFAIALAKDLMEYGVELKVIG
jgi:hypothetical protein